MSTLNSIQESVFIVPGYHGSDEGHWQSWLEGSLENARRLSGVDWESPILSVWAGKIRQQLQRSDTPQWIVAHSFGCLAASIAVSDIPWKVAGLVFVAPADPARFHLLGCLAATENTQTTGAALSETAVPVRAASAEQGLWSVLPRQELGAGGVLIASENDPWLSIETAASMAGEWGLSLINAGAAGHINTESGHGPWPFIRELLGKLTGEHAASDTDSGSIAAGSVAAPERMLMRRGRGSVLANVRQQTRRQMERRL